MTNKAMNSSSPDNEAFPCSLTIRIPFPTRRLANTALRALSVDQELSPLVRRSFALDPAEPPATASDEFRPSPRTGGALRLGPGMSTAGTESDRPEPPAVLVTQYSATTNRMLRVAVNGFFESVGVVLACMRELDADVAGEPWIGDGEEKVDALERVQGLEEGGVVG